MNARVWFWAAIVALLAPAAAAQTPIPRPESTETFVVKPGDLVPQGRDGRRPGCDRDGLVRLVRQHIAEPTDRAHDGKDGSRGTDQSSGRETREQEREAEGEHDRPRRRRRHVDAGRRFFDSPR